MNRRMFLKGLGLLVAAPTTSLVQAEGPKPPDSEIRPHTPLKGVLYFGITDKHSNIKQWGLGVDFKDMDKTKIDRAMFQLGHSTKRTIDRLIERGDFYDHITGA